MRKPTGKSTGARAITLLVISIFLAVTAQAQSSDKTVIEEVLLKSFGPPVEAVTTFAPYHLSGDFNGDGALDKLIIVRIKGTRSELLKDVMVRNPFWGGGKVKYPVNPKVEPTLGIAIIHGAPKSKPNAPAGKFLLLGDSAVLILETTRANSNRAEERKSLMELMKKKVRRPRGSKWPPAIARGDSVLLPSENVDSILYWDGKAYRWEEEEGGE